MFELSRNYERAWRLINEGQALACWLTYQDGKDIALASKFGYAVSIGARGTTYIYLAPRRATYEDFVKHCTDQDVEFYLPLPDDTIVISPEDLEAIAAKVIEEKIGKPLDGLIVLMEETA